MIDSGGLLALANALTKSRQAFLLVDPNPTATFISRLAAGTRVTSVPFHPLSLVTSQE